MRVLPTSAAQLPLLLAGGLRALRAAPLARTRPATSAAAQPPTQPVASETHKREESHESRAGEKLGGNLFG